MVRAVKSRTASVSAPCLPAVDSNDALADTHLCDPQLDVISAMARRFDGGDVDLFHRHQEIKRGAGSN
jgi:hypothetical protein